MKLQKLKSFLFLAIVAMPQLVSAQATNKTINNLTNVGQSIYGKQFNPNKVQLEVVIGNLVRILLGFVGMIFMILIIIGAFEWMTAGGNEEKVKNAKKRISNATVGLVIVTVAYVIAYWVTNAIQYAVSTGQVGP